MTRTKPRTAAFAIAALTVVSAFGATGVASAARPSARMAATTLVAPVSATRVARPITTANPHPVVSTVTVSAQKIQGGATGDGPFTEAECEALGDKAEEYASKGLEEIKNGDLNAGQADGAAAQGVVDYGMDMGCFFTVPW